MKMFMDPAFFFDLGLQAFRRSPFFNLTQLSLKEGECDFRVLERRDGVVIALGPNTSFFDRPGRSVCRWPGTHTIPRQSPHPVGPRSRLKREINAFLHMFCGGGDVKINRVSTCSKQQQILLTAGAGNVVEKIDLADLNREGAPSLMFMQPAYLCSSENVWVRSIACDASVMSWARAPYVYEAHAVNETLKPAVLCLAGRTMVWSERLEPGESRDFALGNVIAATTNIRSTLRPTSQSHPHDDESGRPRPPAYQRHANNGAHTTKGWRRIRQASKEFISALKVFCDSIRAREGFLVCEMTNYSDARAYVFVQLNKSGFYGGSGLIGFVINTIGHFIRLSHIPLGR